MSRRQQPRPNYKEVSSDEDIDATVSRQTRRTQTRTTQRKKADKEDTKQKSKLQQKKRETPKTKEQPKKKRKTVLEVQNETLKPQHELKVGNALPEEKKSIPSKQVDSRSTDDFEECPICLQRLQHVDCKRQETLVCDTCTETAQNCKQHFQKNHNKSVLQYKHDSNLKSYDKATIISVEKDGTSLFNAFATGVFQAPVPTEQSLREICVKFISEANMQWIILDNKSKEAYCAKLQQSNYRGNEFEFWLLCRIFGISGILCDQGTSIVHTLDMSSPTVAVIRTTGNHYDLIAFHSNNQQYTLVHYYELKKLKELSEIVIYGSKKLIYLNLDCNEMLQSEICNQMGDITGINDTHKILLTRFFAKFAIELDNMSIYKHDMNAVEQKLVVIMNKQSLDVGNMVWEYYSGNIKSEEFKSDSYSVPMLRNTKDNTIVTSLQTFETCLTQIMWSVKAFCEHAQADVDKVTIQQFILPDLIQLVFPSTLKQYRFVSINRFNRI
jgi:hypothetical protein